MKQLKLLFILLSFSMILWGQNKTLTGVVKDEIGDPIPGVTIKEVGVNNGTITDMEGYYSISVAGDESELEFSFIGFETARVKASGKTEINLTLKDATSDLDELVVIGYGEVRKSDLTGSIGTVDVQEDVARQYQSVDQMLQGRSAGVQVTGNSGSPGSAVSVRIRGSNSLRGNNEPLYVVDGVIITTAGEDVMDPSTDANEIQSPQNGLTGLNPQDIENIEILKDASATAIYGSRGANGVVLITTKSGSDNKGDKATISVYGSTEYNVISKKLDVLDAPTYAEYQNEANALLGRAQRYEVDGNDIYTLNENGDRVGDPLEQVDWQDRIYQASLSYNAGLSISGRSDKSNFYFSSSFADQTGIVETSNIKRGDVRFNYSRDLNDKLKFDSRTSMMLQNGSFAQGGSKSGGNRSFSKQILTYKPLIEDSDGEDADLEQSNPDSWLTDYDDMTEEVRVNTSASLSYTIIKGLKYKMSLGMDYRNKSRSKFYDTGLFVGQKENGLANYSDQVRYAYTFDNIVNYSKQINKKHRITATAGMTYDAIAGKNSAYEVANFPMKNLGSDFPQGGQTVYLPYSQFHDESEIFSLLARANYTFKDKYILTASIRGDQSSKFYDENKWGYFPSAAFAWRAMEEKFIKQLDVFHNLKLRAGWGATGNQAIRSYQTLPLYDTKYYVSPVYTSLVAHALMHIPNPDLKWETTTQMNVGIDMAFFDGKLSTTFDYYRKHTKDLLQETSIGPSNGFSKMFINRGEIKNSGYELSINGVAYEDDNWSVALGVNGAININEVTKLGLAPTTVWENGVSREEVFYYGNGVSTGTYFKQPANVFMEGQAMGVFWGHKTDGIYKTDAEAAAGPKFNGTDAKAGDVRYVDQNNDGDITSVDNVIIGDPNPALVYGFNFDVAYKDFYLTALFEGVTGNDIINGNMMQIGYAEGQTTNILTDTYVNAWRVDQPNNPNPGINNAMIYNRELSDRIVEDGSYLRMSNITLGYNIPTDWIKNISSARVYATGKNLFTLTDYSGYDPQVSSFMGDGTILGVDWTGSPNATSFLMGLSLTF